MKRGDPRSDAPSGRVRIIGGTLRNSRLDVAGAAGLRPTPERVRETVFNWLAPLISGARCLDVCAGTGALGIEALSRGAAGVVFVERDPHVARALGENLLRLKTPGGTVHTGSAQDYLRRTAQPFDVVFLDPPFALDLWSTLAHGLEAAGWLAPAAMIYVESPRAAVPALPPRWQVYREAVAGAVRYALYRRGPLGD